MAQTSIIAKFGTGHSCDLEKEVKPHPQNPRISVDFRGYVKYLPSRGEMFPPAPRRSQSTNVQAPMTNFPFSHAKLARLSQLYKSRRKLTYVDTESGNTKRSH